MPTDPLLEAIARFTEAAPDSDTGSLWDRLLAGELGVVDRFGSVGGAPGSRPPVSADVLSLIDEVGRYCFLELRAARVRSKWLTTEAGDHYRDVHYELLAIHRVVQDNPPQAAIWAALVDRWVREATRVLGLVPTRLTIPRGARCLDCGASQVVQRNAEGEQVRVPALHLIWHDDTISAVWCGACGSSRDPEALHSIAQQLAEDQSLRY